MDFIALNNIDQQSDSKFINVLKAICNNSATDDDINIMNDSDNKSFESNLSDFYITRLRPILMPNYSNLKDLVKSKQKNSL